MSPSFEAPHAKTNLWIQSHHGDLMIQLRRAIKGGGICHHENLKTLHNHFDICRNFKNFIF